MKARIGHPGMFILKIVDNNLRKIERKLVVTKQVKYFILRKRRKARKEEKATVIN